MQLVATLPLFPRPFAKVLRAVKAHWKQGPVPSWTEYMRETR